MPMTLEDAVTRARDDRLDDDGTRWTDQETVRALQYALSDTAYEYIDAGGDQFRRQSQVPSNASGYVDASGLGLAQVHGLSLLVGGRSYRIYAADPAENSVAVDAARTLYLDYSLEPRIGTATFSSGAFSTGGSNPLVTTNGTTQLTTWDNFEDLVCNRAAQKMALKDNDQMVLRSLYQEEQRLLANVMKRDNKPRAKRMPRRQGFYSRLYVWHWDPGSEYIRLQKRLN